MIKILFNLMATIEIPDVEIPEGKSLPPREELEKAFVELFGGEGMIAHGLEITNYGVPADE